jgi:hypothetical protein
MKVKVTYPSGVVEIFEQSDCHTLEEVANCKFGSSDYQSNGVTIEEYVEDEPIPTKIGSMSAGITASANVSDIIATLGESNGDEVDTERN